MHSWKNIILNSMWPLVVTMVRSWVNWLVDINHVRIIKNKRIKIFKIFKSNGLSITVECNLIVTDFLDVTFDLKSATYYPYRKPNNDLLYINQHYNHPPSIINQIPSMISNRISENSCDKNHFDKAGLDYNVALNSSEFYDNTIFIPSQSKHKSQKREIIWFNPL